MQQTFTAATVQRPAAAVLPRFQVRVACKGGAVCYTTNATSACEATAKAIETFGLDARISARMVAEQ